MTQTTESPDDFKGRYPDHSKPDALKAAKFLVSIAKRSQMHIVCFPPDGKSDEVRCQVFDTADPKTVDNIRSFINFQETQPHNVYYVANIAHGCKKVPTNKDITAIRAVVMDFDPDTSLPLDQARDKLRKIAHDFINGPVQPRAITDTGGGMQVVFELIDPIPIPQEDEEAQKSGIKEIELLMRGLARSFGTDTRTCTAKNLFRVPYTRNLPNGSKLKVGRPKTVSGLWFEGGPRVTIQDLQRLVTVSTDDGPTGSAPEFEGLEENDVIAVLGDPSSLPGEVRELVRDMAVRKVVKRPPPIGDTSGGDFYMACNLARLNVTPKHIALLLSAYGHKVEAAFQQGRLFSYITMTVAKGVARAGHTHLLDDFEDEADKEQTEEERRQRHERLDPLTIDEALSGLFDGDNTDMVDGLIGPKELLVLYGKPGSGKTFIMIDMAYHIAQGAAWNQREVRPSKVVYIATESARGILFRLKALVDRYGPTPDFYIIPSSVNMFDKRLDLKPLADKIFAKVGRHVGLIVIDTLARAMGGGNENSAQDMTALIENGDRLRNAFGAAIAWVHHSGKNEALGARGSSALLAATDIEVEVADGTFRTTKMRDREHLDYRFHLNPVQVGAFADGTTVTSCTVQWRAGGREFSQSTPGQQALQMIVDVLRQVQKPMSFDSILAQATSTQNRKWPVTKNSLQRLLKDACESDTNMVFTRTESPDPKKNQNLVYKYGLVNW